MLGMVVEGWVGWGGGCLSFSILGGGALSLASSFGGGCVFFGAGEGVELSSSSTPSGEGMPDQVEDDGYDVKSEDEEVEQMFKRRRVWS